MDGSDFSIPTTFRSARDLSEQSWLRPHRLCRASRASGSTPSSGAIESPNNEIENGLLPLGPLEIARLDNDPVFPKTDGSSLSWEVEDEN